MEQTPNYNIPVPNPDAAPPRNIDEEFLRLAAAWLIVDNLLKIQADGLAGKANGSHGHQMGDIAGLVSALAGKLDATAQFSLDDLADVDGATDAAFNYVLVKGINGIWRASSAIAALGPHQHQRSDIVGLDNYVDGRFNALIGGAPDALNAINELAAAIGNDPNFAVSVSQQVADVKDLVPDYFTGFVPAYVSTTSFSVGAGVGIFGGKKHTTAVATGCSLAAIFGTGIGCLDTGTIQANKTYFVFAIRNISSGATAFLASLKLASSGLVAVPAGWELLSGCRVGMVITNGSGQIMPFVQRGNHVSMQASLWFTSTTDFINLANAIGIPIGVSVDVDVIVGVQVSAAGVDAYVIIADAEAANSLLSGNFPQRVVARARSGNDYPDSSTSAGHARSNDLGQVYVYIDHTSTAALSSIYICGWTDYQCRRLGG
jgi:hypothetical protein